MTQKKQYIRRVSQEPQQDGWSPDSIYLIKGHDSPTVEIVITDTNSDPYRIDSSCNFKGVFGDPSGYPSNPEENDMVGLQTEFGIQLFIYDGEDWETTTNLKTYIDEQVKWETKEF